MMSSDLIGYSLFIATNKLEIVLNPMETREMCSREGLESLCETNKNQHDTWCLTAKLGCFTLLSTLLRNAASLYTFECTEKYFIWFPTYGS